MRFKTFDNFSPQAAKMRAEYDQRFKDPFAADGSRFIWDYWHVPEQYTLLRTPAYTFFKKTLYHEFHRHLDEWGRANLGCHDVSPPWLSCYVEGCRQEIHRDVPHGPLAFVFSLTPIKRKFRGGETFLLEGEGYEKKDLIRKIQPRFNRLTVFDPAIPHGVEEVKGTHDVRHGRLVIHGWFVNPRPFWYGPLKAREVESSISLGLADIFSGKLSLGNGMVSLRLKISPAGEVRGMEALVDTLHDTNTATKQKLIEILRCLRFPKKSAGTTLVLPLVSSY